MSENIGDATQLSDTTRLSDSTQLSNSTYLSDAMHLASAPHTGTTPSTGSTLQSVALPSLPQRPSQASSEKPPPTTDVASAPAGNDGTMFKPREGSTSTIPQQAATQSQPQSQPQRQSSKAVQAAASALPASINSGLLSQPAAQVRDFQQSFNALVENVSKMVIGKIIPIKQCVAALIAGGHILLEDNPGTGKTQLTRDSANSISTGFKRVQLMPNPLSSDVVGVTFCDQKCGEFGFHEGPIFASIMLADEINCASPKTRFALLGVIGEQKVTVDGVTHDVPQPFIVIVTQNPIEQLGTYRLPETQMNRSFIKTSIGYPGHDVSVDTLKQVDITDRAQTISPVLSGDDVMRLRQVTAEIYVDNAIHKYIIRLVEVIRHNEKITVGSSICGALALTRCVCVWTTVDSYVYVVSDDIKDSAVAVLAHRTTLTPGAAFDGVTPESLIAQMLEDASSPTIGSW